MSVIWFIFVSRYWSVIRIETNDLHDLSREDVASTTYDLLDNGGWKPWDKRNIFFVDPKQLEKDLHDRLFVEQVTVDKVYPNVLRLKIEERQRSVFLASKDQLLNVDTNGIVTGDAGGKGVDDARMQLRNKLLATASRLPLIVFDLPEPASAGYQVTKPDNVKRWITAYKSFVGSGIKFTYVTLEMADSQTVRLKTDKGFDLVVDLSQALQPQIEMFNKFLQVKPKNMVVNEYVDVRVLGKLFIK
jgi:cell division septal protein FtsQ